MSTWRKRPLDEVVYVLIGALALLLGTGAIYLNWQQAQRTSLQASQTRQAVSSIRQLLVILYRGETGQRGFLLTGANNYLVPYEQAGADMPKILERLHQLGEQEPDFRQAILDIDRLARAKMGELQTAVELVQEGDPEAAELLVRSNFGKLTMDQLVLKLGDLEKKVFISEEQFSADLQEQMRRTAALTVVCSIALFALFAIENHRVASRKRAAEKSSEVKSAFLASMSHELRTPLNAIIGYSQMLQEEAEESGRASDLQDLQRIEGAGKHLLELINSILELSKIEAGRLEVHPSEFAVDALVREVTGLIEPLAQRRGNRLTVDVGPNVGRMFSDATRIKQALLNLSSNAAKFTSNGKINLRVRRLRREDRDWIEFAVQDSGPGIKKEDLVRLFEPFSQLDSAHPRQGEKLEGTGLGLSITRRLCRLLGGDVTVDTSPGAGSTFCIQLPAEVTPGYFGTVAPQPAAHPTVLVIDDDPAVHDLMRRVLSKHPLEVAFALNGEAGLRLARELRPAVITLDVIMEGLDGYAVLEQLKADPQLSHIPVILLSVSDDTNGLAADEFLTKPVAPDVLSTTILRHASGHRSKSVLIVDDEPAARELLSRPLESMGWRTIQAGDGAEGLRLFAQELPGIIFLDLMMPGMDGFEFLSQLRQQPEGQTTPVVVVTSKDLTGAERAQLREQATTVLAKGSFKLTDILEQLATTASRRPA